MENHNVEQEDTATIPKASNPAIPGAIIIAGILIAGAVIYSSGSAPRVKNNNAVAQQNQLTPETGGAVDNIKPVSNQDHIRGNPDASVKIVEFSDTECPFCARFHPTMKQAIDEYGKKGQVAWAYRHFPLDQIHSKARKEAEATECANELGGNEKFWAYLDRLFEVTPSNNNLDPVQLPEIAKYVGLDQQKFQACLNSDKYTQHVADDLTDATNSGGQGTPYSVVIAKNGKKFVISGAQPHASIKSVIDIALQEK